MTYLFYFFALVLVWLSYKSFLGGLRYLRYFEHELAKPLPAYTPFATIIAPCRGLDDGFGDNLAALLEQDYPEYEVIFVVDDVEDQSVPAIREITSKNAMRTKLVVAPKAVGSAQKIENLREAVLHADERSEVFAFVDSDARPQNTWLRYLVAPLEDSSIGATTGYRWFISRNRTFASEMRSAWNASIASALGPNTGSNFCWGGATAMRRDTFDRVDMRDRWSGTLADDLAVTRAVRDAGLRIVFVPQALTPSVDDCTFGELVEFTTRQIKIVRVCEPKLWLMTLFGSTLFNSVLIAAFSIIVLSTTNDLVVAAALATLLLVFVFSVGKAWLRLRAVKLALDAYEYEVSQQFLTQNTLWLLTGLLFFYNSVVALFSRRITWRGITYELKSPTETVIIGEETKR
jgi:cellulose synthase/poly-beta-1,6-N-acetylglucosamine synthase-like glycosyltransferase